MISTSRVESNESFGRASKAPKGSAAHRYLAADFLAELVPIVAAVVVFCCALLSRSAAAWLAIGVGQDVPASYGLACLGALIAFGVFRHARPPDGPWRKARAIQSVQQSSMMVGVFALLFLLLALLGIISRYDVGFLVVWAGTSVVVMYGALLALGDYLRILADQGRISERVALYGNRALCVELEKALTRQGQEATIIGVYDAATARRDTEGGETHRGINELIACARDGLCDHVVLAVPPQEYDALHPLLSQLAELPIAVDIYSDASRLPLPVRGVTKIGAALLLDVQRHPLGARGVLVKAAMDYTIAAAALCAALPLMALIAIAIKLETPGPVFFIQPRGGHRGKPFNIIKFRSMTVLENGPALTQVTRHDVRVTRLGSLLRRTSLDELPQLFNVLRGELSLVGPRPHALAHDKHYGAIVEHYAIRHRIKPGITGWAQVNGYRSETRNPNLMRERIRHDLDYIENWSPLLDIKILIRTIGLILWDSHAY